MHNIYLHINDFSCRKKKIEEAMEQGWVTQLSAYILIHRAYLHRGETPLLYTVLPEKTAAVGGAMMGSDHVYEISGVSVEYTYPDPWCQKPYPYCDNIGNYVYNM